MQREDKYRLKHHSTNEAPPSGPLAAARGGYRCDAVKNHSVSLCKNVSVSECLNIHMYLFLALSFSLFCTITLFAGFVRLHLKHQCLYSLLTQYVQIVSFA